jgi:Kef-type K+ transport system membrane component KefB
MNASVQQSEALLFSVLLQLVVMIAAARGGNTLSRRLGQPGVIGEIIAGLALGPSLLGYFLPHTSQALFGAHAATPIIIISQLGLILLMFQIGMDFEFTHLRSARNRGALLAVAAASVCVPLLLGLLIGRLSAAALAPGIDPTAYCLFCGVGLAITAVPILGRILREYDLTRTEVGVVGIAAAALNDVVGWLLLAGIASYAVARFSGAHVLLQLLGLLVFVLILRWVVRPLVQKLLSRDGHADSVSPNLMAMVLCLLFIGGICTYRLGIFAIFGGFAVGLLFHQHARFVRAWRLQVGEFVLVFFLPVFFTFTGLRTNVLGLSSGEDAAWLLVMLAAAVLGKVVPVYIAARLSGFDSWHSAILGTLMNTRGLMELIVLNIGLDLGFIPPKVFTMLVLMAVLTTLMTGPLLRLLLPRAGYGGKPVIEA